MKKNLTIVALSLLLVGLAACGGGGKYAEVKSVMEKQVAGMETFISGLEKASSGPEVAAAFSGYADVIKTLAPQMKALSEKYPEMKNEKEMPAELKPIMDKMEELTKRLGAATMKAAPYLMDPAVQEAQKKFMEAASALR